MKYNLLAVALILQHLCHAQNYPVRMGPHQVGFKVFNHYDYGRYVQPEKDFSGQPNAGSGALPIQISMWYPAKSSSRAKTMLYEDYLALTIAKNDFKDPTEQQKMGARNLLRFPAEYGAGIVLTGDALELIAKTPVTASRDAAHEKALFPLIISGLDGGPSSANILYEYLASIGYVVIANPSIGRTATMQANNPQVALAERIGNLEHVFSFVNTLPFVDKKHVGVLGINFDGTTALLFQMKNMRADAVVSIDGWEGKAGSKGMLLNSIFFDARKMRVPYFVVQQDENDPSGYLSLDSSVLDTLAYSRRYSYVLNGMNHAYLAGNLGMVAGIPEEKKVAYQFLYLSIGHFFDAYLKANQESLQFIDRGASANGFTAEIVKSEVMRKALPAVPTSEEFENLVMAGDMEEVFRICRDARKVNPHVRLFDFQTLNLYAFRFSTQMKWEKVLALRLLASETFPASMKAMESLGDAYLSLGNRSKAKDAYEAAIGLFAADPYLNDTVRSTTRKSIEMKLNGLDE